MIKVNYKDVVDKLKKENLDEDFSYGLQCLLDNLNLPIEDHTLFNEVPCLKAYWLNRELDRDTLVGTRALMLNGKFCGLITLDFRKSREVICWAGEDQQTEVRNYLLEVFVEQSKEHYNPYPATCMLWMN